LDAALDAGRTVVHARHSGPLRLLKTLYPEGDAIAHAVLVHPPGGLVGGDRLDIEIDVAPGAHLLVTTPAATRFYRSIAGEAVQAVQAQVAAGGRLEWLPQETIAYRGCDARNEVRLCLAPGAQLLAGEVLALGLPAAEQAFTSGGILQHLEVPGLWLDRGWLAADDAALLDGPAGLAGARVLGTLLAVQDGDLPEQEALLADSRACLEALPTSGVTCLRRGGRSLLVARVLAGDVETAALALRRLRALWRQRLWALPDCEPRVWAT
jgi:urease accessory protein